MFLSKVDGKIKKVYFDGKIYAADGTLYNIPVSAHLVYNATVETSHRLNIPAHNLNIGDNILINAQGVNTPNIVNSIGTNKVNVEDPIYSKVGTTVSLETNLILIDLAGLPAGFYRFTDNEGLLISESYLSIYCSYANIKSRYDDLNRNRNIVLANQEALSSIYGDFATVNKFWDKVDIGQLRELLMLKILCQIISTPDLKMLACKDYTLYAKKVSLGFETDDNNETSPDPDAPDDGTGTAGNGVGYFKFKYGVK